MKTTSRPAVLLAAALTCTLAAAGCSRPAAEPTASAEAPAASPTASAAAAAASPSQDCVSVDMSINHVPYTVRTLAGTSRSAFTGKVVAVEAGVWNTRNAARPAVVVRGPGSAMVLTPYNVLVARMLGGEARKGTVRLLNEGGHDGCSVFHAPYAPQLAVGGTYLFWTREGDNADGTLRPDLDVIITAWPVDAGGNVTTEEDGVMTVDAVAAIAAASSGG